MIRVFGTAGGEESVGKRAGKRVARREGIRFVVFVAVVEGVGLDAQAVVVVLGERWGGGEVEDEESESLGESIMLSRSSSESGCSSSAT